MACSICRNRSLVRLTGKSNPMLVRCRDCGLVQVENLEKEFNLKNYDYYKDRLNSSQEELYDPLTSERYSQILQRQEKYRKNNVLLDIGCGEGQFLSVAKKLSWQAKGVELAPYAAQICQKFGLDILCCDFLELDLKND